MKTRRRRRQRASNHGVMALMAVGVVLALVQQDIDPVVAVIFGAATLLTIGAIVISLQQLARLGKNMLADYRAGRLAQSGLRLSDMRKIDPFEFEAVVGTLFKTKGYVVKNTPDRADNGLDLIMHRDGKSYAVQVKRYSAGNAIGEPMLREFYGSYTGAFDEGIYVTTSSFTQAARRWGKSRGVQLMDGQAIETLAFEALD